MKTAAVARDVDEYIAGARPEVQEILEKVRETIRKAAPKAEETISYEIPAYKLNGRSLIYFAAHKKHLGVYPVPLDVTGLEEELAPYLSGKRSAKFPVDGPIPYRLITKLVKLSVKENQARTDAKRKK